MQKNKINIFRIMTVKWDSDRVTDEFRHIKISDKTVNNYKKYLGDIDLKGKTIIDYGCGGGHLGGYLFEDYEIKKYIGFDICNKSVKFAKKNLSEYNAEIHHVKDHVDFSKYKADVFISFECIQHFPAKGYLINFLKSINESKIPELIIQYRLGRGVSFNSKNVMTWMCKLPKGYLEKKLTNYIDVHKDNSDSDIIPKEWIYFISKKDAIIANVKEEETTLTEDELNEIEKEIKDDKSEITEI